MILDGIYGNIEGALTKAVSSGYESEIELEVRFSNTYKRNFSRVLSEITKELDPEVIQTTDYSYKGRRYTYVQGQEQHGEAITKQRVEKWDLNNYQVRVSLSLEKQVQKDVDVSGIASLSTYTRSKTRNRFQVGSVYIDLTTVTSSSPGKKSKDTYEIEIEMIPPYTPPRLKNMSSIVDYVARMILGSEILYDYPTSLDVIRSCNNIFGKGQGLQTISEKILANARNIKKKDAVWGGLLRGGVGPSKYTVTLKAEGLRHILYFHSSGIWLLSPPSSLNYISTARLDDAVGTLIDGEVILESMTQNGGVGAKYMYIPIDMLAFKGDRDIQSKNFSVRSAKRDLITRWFQSINTPDFLKLVPKSLFQMHAKEFKILETEDTMEPDIKVDCLNKVVSEVNGSASKVLFKSDGLIITPEDAPYNTIDMASAELVDHNRRTLSVHPDICKVKRWIDLTIDLFYTVSDGKKILRMIKGDTMPDFVGTGWYPFNQEKQVDWSHPLLNESNSGTVIEFGPVKENRPEGTIVILRPVRRRLDKSKPNPERIAHSVWNDINNPFSVDSLEGKTLDLAFQSHTQFKKALLSQIPADADVIDLGAGRGGDVQKLKHVHKVLAVEPSAEFSIEYQRRVDGLVNSGGTNTQYKVLTTSAQDTNAIINAAAQFFEWGTSVKEPRPVYVISMFSLSFFWKDKRTLEGFARTLSSIKKTYPGDSPIVFTFTTIEGARTKEIIEKRGVSSPDGSYSFELGQGKFKYSPPNVLELDIEDSIVKKQTEYLVFIEELSAMTLSNTQTGPLDREKFLSKDERDYNHMYVYGTSYITDNGYEFPPYDPNLDGYLNGNLGLVPVSPPVVQEVKEPRLDKSDVRDSFSALDHIEESKEVPPSAMPKMSYDSSLGLDSPRWFSEEEQNDEPVLRESDREVVLLPLPVSDKSKLNISTLPYKGDDEREFLEFTLPEASTPGGSKIVRVSTIHTGNSFIHSFLKVTSKEYNMNGGDSRVKMVNDFVKKMAEQLTHKSGLTEQQTLELYGGVDPREPGSRYPLTIKYYQFQGGDLARYIDSLGQFEEGPVYLYNTLTSNVENNYQMYGFVSELTGYGIKVYRFEPNGEVSLADYLKPKDSEPKVVIAILENSEGTYEPLGWVNQQGLVIFSFNS